MKWHPYLELMSKRPTAIKYTSFYDDLPDNWREYIKDIDYDDKKTALEMLSCVLETHNLDTAEKILDHNLKNGVTKPKSLLATYYHMTEDRIVSDDREVSKLVPEVPSINIQLNDYNKLMPPIEEAIINERTDKE